MYAIVGEPTTDAEQALDYVFKQDEFSQEEAELALRESGNSASDFQNALNSGFIKEV